MSPPERDKEVRLPILTVLTILICVAICIMINVQGPTSWAVLERWGYYSDSDIFDGAYWVLITGAFVHVDPIHLVFNMYWLFILGAAMERTIGPLKWAGFVLAAAFISSGVELMSGTSGIGFSGVAYAMFGFAWLTKDRFPEMGRVTGQKTFNIFVGWGILFIILSYLKIFNVGNVAHVSGLVFGGLVGAWIVHPTRKVWIAQGFAVLTIASITSLFWNPLSPDWVGKQAIAAHERKDYNAAIYYYQRYLDVGGDLLWGRRALAELYGFKQDKVRYREAISNLKVVDFEAMQEVIKDYGEPY